MQGDSRRQPVLWLVWSAHNVYKRSNAVVGRTSHCCRRRFALSEISAILTTGLDPTAFPI